MGESTFKTSTLAQKGILLRVPGVNDFGSIVILKA